MNKYRVRGFRRGGWGPTRHQYTVLANSFAEAKEFIYVHFYPQVLTRVSTVSLIVDGKETIKMDADDIYAGDVGSVRHVKIFSHGIFRLL